MHGLLTGQESRQQLYTMLTRGRHGNHLYLQVVGDGDPHAYPTRHHLTPHADRVLGQILARDEAPVSASTLLREFNNAAARLFQAVQRYTDGLHVAAEQLVGPKIVAELDQADQFIPGLTTEPAWPTLRAHLLALAAETGKHPLRHPHDAARDWRPEHQQETWPPSSTGASESSRLPTQVRCPGSRAFHQRFKAIPSGAPIWQSDLSWSPNSPTRFKTTPAKVTARQPGLQQELATAPSSAKSQRGGPPTASIPKTRGQPEETNSKPSRPSGNSTSTEVSPAAATTSVVLTSRGPRLLQPRLIAGPKIDSACSDHPRSTRTPHPAPGHRSSPAKSNV